MSRPTHEPWSAAVLAYPMHGQRKLLDEGYRTRDGHVIEWLGQILGAHGGVDVVSRPDPALTVRRRAHRAVASGTHPIETRTLRIPDLRDRRRWWVASATAYPQIHARAANTPAIVWNPFTALARPGASPFTSSRTTVLDLLDDWSAHYAFASISGEVERAYENAFRRASVVTANGEGSAALARRFGRDDVILLPNGCDPERFDTTSTASGPTTIGYVGKIGRRLDLAGIVATVTALPQAKFAFAGPILDPEYRGPLAALPNLDLLGDVHYDDVPALLQRFDVGWVPHRVGDGEVGGDVIKTYEYRAAGLATLSTPIDGAGQRGVAGITTAPMEHHARILDQWITRAGSHGGRIARNPVEIPRDVAWQDKCALLVDLLLNTSVAVSR